MGAYIRDEPTFSSFSWPRRGPMDELHPILDYVAEMEVTSQQLPIFAGGLLDELLDELQAAETESKEFGVKYLEKGLLDGKPCYRCGKI